MLRLYVRTDGTGNVEWNNNKIKTKSGEIVFYLFSRFAISSATPYRN